MSEPTSHRARPIAEQQNRTAERPVGEGQQAGPPPFALLLARQRSGTGALGSVLDKQPSLKYLGEILHPDNAGEADNFFTFLAERVGENAAAAMPWEQELLFEGYLARMAERYPGRVPVLDVKYRSLHHLAGGWRGLLERPWLIRHADARGAAIIHLTRQNYVESFVSGRLAEANRVWHATEADRLGVQSAVIDIRALSHYIETTSDEVALIERWLKPTKRLATLDYGEMMDGEGALAEGPAHRLAALLGVPRFEERAPSFVKQAPSSLGASIENMALVRRALSGTPHAWMVGEARRAG
ncbi:MAG: hypothetical protein AAFP17_08565 [Pseudomonadota bacterium]